MSIHPLEYIFHPQSIAVVGVSPDPNRHSVGRFFVSGMINQGFRGRLYAVSLEGGEYEGRPIYLSLKDIPDTIDYAMVAVPSRSAVQMVRDAAAKGAKLVHFFTGGFSETGGTEESRLERELVAVARETGVRILGPNCMGLYYPKGGLTFNPFFSKRIGRTGLISQSGGNSIYAARMAERRGVFYSKIVSYGNAADLNECDFLDYLTADPETDVIALYVEGVDDGPRFLSLLNRAARTKPVIVYKGGMSAAGSSAAFSHTGSLAGSNAVWDAAIKQAGAIRVNDIDEMMDMALLFENTSPAAVRNTVIVGVGGGNSVLVADTWSAAGLPVPALSPEVREKLKKALGGETGSSYRNPMDIFAMFTLESLQKVLDILFEQPEINNVLVHLPVGMIDMVSTVPVIEGTAAMAKLPEEYKRRLITVLYSPITRADIEMTLERGQVLADAGIPVFPSAARAAQALKRFTEYHRRNNTNPTNIK